MESTRFDNITKTLASASSRRKALKGLIGGALATAGVIVGSRQAVAARPHLCCIYTCPTGKLKHSCNAKDVNVLGSCANPSEDGCFLLDGSIVTKCSACGTAL
jgi:hypothetical protein